MAEDPGRLSDIAHDVAQGRGTGPETASKVISLFGSLLMAVGPFLPWAIVWTNGYEYPQSALHGNADGMWALAAGLAIACFGLVRFVCAIPTVWLLIQLVVAVLIAGIAVRDIDAVSNMPVTRWQYDPEPAIGPGLWIVLLGALLTIAGAFPTTTLLRKRLRR